jgi:hypothetical protein
MKNILFTLALLISFSSFSQTENNTEYENIVDLYGVETKIIKGSLEVEDGGTSLSFTLPSGKMIVQGCVGCLPYGTEFEYINYGGEEIKIVKGSLEIRKNNKNTLKILYVTPERPNGKAIKTFNRKVNRNLKCEEGFKIIKKVDDFGEYNICVEIE